MSRKTQKTDTGAKGKLHALTPVVVKGARVHNLKNITVSFPRNKFIVVTGVSGSGKSSLTIDTLFAEGQRRYAESLSAYARQFMQRMNKPDVDLISGLCPAIAIEQKVITKTPRSTVGSMTEIYDYLRLLFARIGKTFSPLSGREVKKDDVGDVVEVIKHCKDGDKILILVPFRSHANRNNKEELNILLQKGFSRLYHETEVIRIEDLLESNGDELAARIFSKGAESPFVLIDRLVKKEFEEEDIHRISDSVGTAFFEGEGTMHMDINGRRIQFSNKFELDGIRFDEPAPNLFSFNNPVGACPVCEGFSQVLGLDPDLVIPDKRLSVYEGAVAPWKGEKLGQWKEQFIRAAKKFDFPIHKPVMELSKSQYDVLWKGNQYADGIDAFFREVEQNLYKVQYRVLLSRYRGRTQCPECNGYRLKKEALYVQVGGRHIGELCEWPIRDLKTWFQELKLTAHEGEIAFRILLELHQRLDTMISVGLGYLTLNRLANSLSGGESQRIQLTRSLGSNLTDSLYILDEPSIGLHSRDTENLIRVLKDLQRLGNTVVVVEHDEMMMREADHIIDMGPFASHLGGRVVATGDMEEIMANPSSLTGRYLSGDLNIPEPSFYRKWSRSITVRGAMQHNLKDIDVIFPLNTICAVTGVSGSGKTTLVKKIFYPLLKKMKGEFVEKPGMCRALEGDWEDISHIELIDQDPIGKSSRSNPVTYIKAYDEIRDLYSKLPLSKMRGYQPRHFSFNVDGGRCDACKGEGEQVVEMQFLADVHLVCEVCRGNRFKEEVLDVRFKGKNIAELLELSVDEAIDFFENGEAGEESAPQVANRIRPLSDVGLGYVKLGQSSATLSGGEAQRVKLASFLGLGKNQGKTIFIFDEPTTGLHFHDINKLMDSFHRLVEIGHSIIVIEHNTDVIRSCDWVIDLGPEAGDAGGELVFAGTPADLKKSGLGFTSRYL
jgi:excinuclease ABC subunit A